jgi:hypothetical protein
MREKLRSEIHELNKFIWYQEELPHQCKELIVIPNHKKGDETDCGNYRGISLLSTKYKTFSNIFLSRLTPYAEEITADHQCGFGRNINDQIFCIRHVLQKMGVQCTVHKLFIDFKKAYDSVRGGSIIQYSPSVSNTQETSWAN